MDNDQRRKAFVFWYTQGVTPSLAKFLDSATPDEAEAMFDALVDVVKRPAIDFKTGEVLAVAPVTPAPFAGEAFGMSAPISVEAQVVPPGEPTDEDLANQPPPPVMPVRGAVEVTLPEYDDDDEPVWDDEDDVP